MNLMAISRQKENGVVKPVIIHKQNGVYTEYDLSQLLGPAFPVELHYVDAQTAYFISSDMSLYKLDFSKKEWVKTNTSGLVHNMLCECKSCLWRDHEYLWNRL
jgi:hypothetical protein